MSQPSRADRRRTTRTGGPAHPPKRDPMVTVYIIVGAVIVLVLAGFGGWNAYNNHLVAGITAQELATPTPGVPPTPKPIVLTGQPTAVVGKVVFPPGNSLGGGRGLPVDGIPCELAEQAVIHIHVHITIYNHGTQIAVPKYAGLVPLPGGTATQPNICLYWLHTHDASGIVHIEAGQDEAPNGGLYTLGNFFDIAGYTLKSNQVASFKGPVTAYVNGELYTGDLNAITFTEHKLITLEVGTPLVKPPTYTFPAGY